MNNTNIKAGDIVKVVDWEKNYSTYDAWFLTWAYRLETEWLARYAYGDNRNCGIYHTKNSDNRLWIVLAVVDDFALITQQIRDCKGAVYLIKVNGLSSFTRSMTLSEIEAELGYPVKIVKEK